MTDSLPDDPQWPRALRWLRAAEEVTASATDAAAPQAEAQLAVLGVPAWRTSITPTGAKKTPAAIREALLRYSTYSASHDIDVGQISAVDLGQVADPDGPEGEARVADALAALPAGCELLVALGGDNSITYSVLSGLAARADMPALGEWGLITVDAHHDLRDGVTNGSPVRRLIEAGLPGTRVAQIGIADFSNSAAYAQRARELGVTVVPRSELRSASLFEVVGRALAVVADDGRPVYVDLDVDVCDRAEVPGCPASAPGGLSADELRQLAFLFARDSRVRAIDITEIDATTDAADRRTVRLGALLVLEAAAGLCVRVGAGAAQRAGGPVE